MIEERSLGSGGTPRGRSRDLELVRYVGRHGLVRIEQVMSAMGAGRTVTYDRVAACIAAGLLERLELVRSEPGLLRASRDGLRYAGLGLPVARVSPGAVEHWLRCASTAQLLGERHGHHAILSERELALAERIEGAPIASAKVGELPGGAPRLHRPDLVILTEDRPIAVEVELTPKSPRRLQGLIRNWRRATWVAEVHYHCAPGQTRRALDRAIESVRAGERIRVFEVVGR